jgi:decaprenylphospho-beta-D-ribofuranose 2-oxidase
MLGFPGPFMSAKTSVASDAARLGSAPAQPLEAAPPHAKTAQLSGWGRIPAPGMEHAGERLEAATRGAVLSRGLGRSYGDSSLPARPGDKVVSSVLADRLLELDLGAGVVRAEAGLSLAAVNRLVIPHGWFPPVTPGTKFVTLGGMVASDVHGKNHHVAGCFGAHVRELRVRLADDRILSCSPREHADLFWATVGGMGLVGHILEVEFQLQRISSPWIWMESERIGNIDEYLAAFARTATEWPMTMGWIDCVTSGRALGRGILMAGRWATREEAPAEPPRAPRERRFPFDLPNWACNPLSVRAFNAAYYHRHLSKQKRALVSPETFFYPLDAILEWNRGYGSRGFTQHQCVLPRAAGAAAVREFMVEVTRLGAASPVCVIKDCGPEGQGLLSFPLEGTSIAIDLAVTTDTQRIVDRLNDFVVAAGGRIYLTKDRFTRAEHFQAMEPRLPRFLAARDKWDPERRLRSAQSVRLLGDRA